MTSVSARLRFFRFLLLGLQLSLWGAAPVADARLDAESARAIVHIEAHTQSSCPASHPTNCAICHFLQTFASPAHGEAAPPAALSRTPRILTASARVTSGALLLSPLPRAPPFLS